MNKKRTLIGCGGLLGILILLGAVLVWHSLVYRVKGDFFEANGVKIHYTIEGAGEPVILVHGYGANADVNWRAPGVIRALKDEFQVIALDLRGHGLSDKPHDPAQYGIEMVEDVIRLMDHLKIEKAHVVGYSMGGFITLKLLTMFPDRLVSAAPCAAGWESPEGERVAILTGIADSLEKSEDFSPLLRALEPGGEEPTPMKLAAFNTAMRSINDVTALACIMRRFIDLAVTEEELRANTVPVLSIVGSEDPLRSGIDNMNGVLAHHEIVFVEGGDHMTTIADPKYTQALKDFLKRNALNTANADAA